MLTGPVALKSLRDTIVTALRTPLNAAWTTYTACLNQSICNVNCDDPSGQQNCDVLQMGDMFLQFQKHGLLGEDLWRTSPDNIIEKLKALTKRQYPPAPTDRAYGQYVPYDKQHQECHWFKGVENAVRAVKADPKLAEVSGLLGPIDLEMINRIVKDVTAASLMVNR